MKIQDEWAEEHWDVIAMMAVLLIAVAVSAGLGVLYNVAAVGLDPSASPSAVELRSPPAGLQPDPVRQPAPLS